MQTLAIASTRVLQKDATFSPAAVLFNGSFIERVCSLEDVDPSVTLIDVGSKPVTPAFVNAHTHVALGFLRGFDIAGPSAGNLVEDFFFRIERSLTRDDVKAFARMGAYECLLNGIGLVWDHYYYADAIVEALDEVGIAGVVAPTLQDLSGPGTSQLEAQLEATERIARSSSLAEKGLAVAFGPHATDTVSADLWRRVAAEAERLQIPVHSHAAQSAEECLRGLERTGTSPLCWLRELGLFEQSPQTLLVHCLYARDQDLAALKNANATLGFCPYAQRVFGFPADPRRWSDRNIDWFVATDTSAGNDSMNLQKELRAVAELRTSPTTYSPELRAVQTASTKTGQTQELEQALAVRDSTFVDAADLAEPRALLSRVWSVPGGLHTTLKAGEIAAGALANLLVWDIDHPAFWPARSDRGILQALAMGDTIGAIDTMISRGRVVGNVGDFAPAVLGSDNYRECRIEATERCKRLL